MTDAPDRTPPTMPFADGWPASLDVGPGWYPLIERTHAKLLAIDPNYTVTTVKEKFGGLRIYTNSLFDSDAVSDILDAAENESLGTCDVCGQPGNQEGSTTWVRTRCAEHKA